MTLLLLSALCAAVLASAPAEGQAPGEAEATQPAVAPTSPGDDTSPVTPVTENPADPGTEVTPSETPADPPAQAEAPPPEASPQEPPPAAPPAKSKLRRTSEAQVLPGRIVTQKQADLPASWAGDLEALTDAEVAEYQEVVEAFGAQAAELRSEVSALVQARYRERRAKLQDMYEGKIKDTEREEAKRRLDAIARFETFLAKYPRDPTFSPDAIFRLAELYFEQSSEEFNAALRKYDEDVQAYDRGDLKVEPVSPVKHYERTISLYQRMITEFPDHRLIDGAYYLLGYCLDEQGESDQAVVQFLELTRRFPQSKFYAEAWMRVGEYYFDNDKLPECIAAYNHVLENRESPYYDKALYKLGWAHYRLNEYFDAIARFMEVLDFSQQRKAEGNLEGSDLEPESLQYIAVSLSDDTWERGVGYTPDQDEVEGHEGEVMVGFSVDYFKKIPGRPYEKDVFVRLGDILYDSAKYPGAVKAYGYALQLDPLHPEAPVYQDKIVQCWERARLFEQASKAREFLVENFSEGTPWYDVNREDVEALRVAQNLARASLYTAAIFHHQQAQKFMSQDKYDLAKVENEQAAAGYGEYLKRFPHDRAAYELNYYLADTLYNSLQFRAAADEFAKVRDSSGGSRYRTESAINVYFALQKVIEIEEQEGRIAKKGLMVGKERPDTLQPADEIPGIKRELIDACDRFADLSPQDPRVPGMKLVAAEIFYVYNHYDEAKPRLEEVLEKYADASTEEPGSEAAKAKAEVAAAAANYILDFLLIQKDWVAVEKFAQYVQARNVGEKAEYRTLELGALFNKARQFMEEGETWLGEGKTAEGYARLEEAAGEYVRLVSENKEHEFADKALFNAALAYVKARRFESALRLYERVYQEYDKSDLAPTALWEVADNAYKSYDFEKAISSFFLLVKKYPKSPRRADAQFNAALTLENLQRYEQAAREYETYSRMFPDREDAANVFYKAALVHEKRADDREMIAALNRFLQKFSRDPKQADNVVDAYARIADVYFKQGKLKDADKYFNTTVDEYRRRQANVTSAAGFQAARARFQLAETVLKKYQAITITGKANDQVKGLQKKSAELKKMEKEYQEVLPYKSLEWSLAAAYRLGYLYENLAETILAAPCPPDVKRVGGEEACDEYRVMVEDKFATPLEEKAVAAYEVAYKQSQDSKYQNEWTRRALESLNKYRKDMYPIDKEPRRQLVGELSVGLDAQGLGASTQPKGLKGK